MMPTIVLFQPQIPQNTGNIVRTCHVTGSKLILVGPLGFSINDRWLKRAGLDYWDGVDVETIENLEERLEATTDPFYFFSSHATKRYCDVRYEGNEWLIFGSETAGLPESFTQRWPEKFVTIPMKPEARCLNLATSAGIALFELQRQVGFPYST
jgi:tRNA (cytidine/uridine-2'-O-)-methyltransferase